jgi:hypothetical protein
MLASEALYHLSHSTNTFRIRYFHFMPGPIWTMIFLFMLPT